MPCKSICHHTTGLGESVTPGIQVALGFGIGKDPQETTTNKAIQKAKMSKYVKKFKKSCKIINEDTKMI